MKVRKQRKVWLIAMILLIVIAVVIGTMLTPKAYAATTEDGLFDYSVQDNYVKITKYKGYQTTVTIPSTIDGYPVTVIGNQAFSSCSSLETLQIPNSIETIESFAFQHCTGLLSITIPEGVKNIGEDAFWDCSNLESINLPDTLTTIDSFAFEKCENLSSITIPKNVNSIGYGVFEECNNLSRINVDINNKDYCNINNDGVLYNKNMTKIISYPAGNENTTFTIAKSINTIFNYAFSDCSNLTQINIPNGITTIGFHAFYRCENLTQVEIPNSVTEIGSGAFRGCSKLTLINIPPNITQLPASIFEGSGLKQIDIPDHITSIGTSAFAGCEQLTHVIIPGSVTSIGYKCFKNCTNLTNLIAPASVNVPVGGNPDCFEGCDNLTITTKSITTKYKSSIYEYALKEGINLNLDENAPSLQVTYSTTNPTSENVNVTITANEDIQKLVSDNRTWSYIVNNSKKSITATFTENTTNEQLTVKDLVGNETVVAVNINNIDKVAPTINSVTGNATAWTNGNVTLTISATDNESGIAEYSFDDGENWQTTNSKIYTANTSDIKIKVKDNAGNITPYGETIKIDKIDTTAPELSVEYSTTQLTKESVTVTIKSNEEMQEVDGWTISEDDKTLTKVYTKNATENIDVYDIAGNKTTIQVKVENIDTTAPELSVEYSTTQLTKESVTVTIKSNEEMQEVDGWTISEDDKTLTKVYTKNATENIDVYDIVGNKTTSQVKVENIDTTAPELSIEYDITQPTNKSVTATINANEQLQQLEGWTISEDGKTLTKIYTENTEKNIDVYDLAGNKSTAQVKITNIDKTEIEATVEYSTTILTNKNVTVKIISNKEIKEIDDWILLEDKKTLTKEYTENSSENVKLQDLFGNEREIKISVQNIDKIAPKVNVEYSTLKQTNKSLTVTITANEELKSLEGWTLGEDGKTLTKIYTKNTTENIEIYDLAGNKVIAKMTISNIDTTLPNVEVKYSTTENTNEYVIVTIVSDKQLQEIDGWTISEDGKTLTKKYEKNTVESVKVYDLAGNEISVDISVKNIDNTNKQETEEKGKEESKDQTIEPSILPDTGSKTLIGVIIITTIVAIVLWTKNRKYKDIK